MIGNPILRRMLPRQYQLVIRLSPTRIARLFPPLMSSLLSNLLNSLPSSLHLRTPIMIMQSSMRLNLKSHPPRIPCLRDWSLPIILQRVLITMLSLLR